DQQRGRRVLAELRGHGEALAGDLVEEVGPLSARLLLQVGDQLAEAARLGGVEQLLDGGELGESAEQFEAGQCLDRPARVPHLDEQVRVGGEEVQGGQLGSAGFRGGEVFFGGLPGGGGGAEGQGGQPAEEEGAAHDERAPVPGG